MEDDGRSFIVSAHQREDLIAITFRLHAQHYFPWGPNDLGWFADLLPDGLLGAAADLNNPDFDADIVVTLANPAHDGVPRCFVSGTHDAFPAYEVYVNGEEFYRWGEEAQMPSVSHNTSVQVRDPLPGRARAGCACAAARAAWWAPRARNGGRAAGARSRR